jgi:alkanesulfonate monooxygenase SsuD/methylene tetrahydromethanopterin reductase-like flavin-dependent oxidoreductase (luciferase family)
MTPPERIGDKARWLEGLGYSHLMIPEDYFYVPALVASTLALTATESVPVGTSIVSGLVRSPAVLAMEIAGISRAFPGRFRPGIGLGLPDWLRQMGIMPEKPVAALRESVSSLRRLLAGETVSLDGKHLTLDAIALTHPATEHVPITMGVSGPMLLSVAGELADGTLLAASAGADYFRFARGQVEKGLRKAGRAPADMAYSTVALTCVDHDGDAARAATRPIMASFLAEFGINTMTDAYGISDRLAELIDEGGEEAVMAGMPDEWLEDLALVGTPREVADKMIAWLEAGLDAICIFQPDESLEERTLQLVGEEVIPLVRSGAC